MVVELAMKQPSRFFSLLKWTFIIALVTYMTLFLISNDVGPPSNINYAEIVFTTHLPIPPPTKNWRNFTESQIGNLSALGRYLFLDEAPPPIQNPQKKYKILIWKVGKFLERRHIYHFTNTKFDPFEKCSVRNCELTYDEKELPKSDAVLIHMQRLKGISDLPKENGSRPENQRWVFLTDENPLFTFLNSNVKIKDFNGIFNWSMTYRIESDVPVPYGRTVLKQSLIANKNENLLKNSEVFVKRNDVLIAVLGSNCGGKNHRWDYVKELQKYIKVDFYGKCGTLQCPGHFTKDCDPIKNYKFYLSFENSNCPQYITEKVWWNAYDKYSIPIVMGANKSDYNQLLPPKSFINTDDFARPADLARYILYVNKTRDIYSSFFEWKKYFHVLNEHGYFQSDSYHYCRLCEALNYNSKEKKIYNNLDALWNKQDCYPAWDDLKYEK